MELRERRRTIEGEKEILDRIITLWTTQRQSTTVQAFLEHVARVSYNDASLKRKFWEFKFLFLEDTLKEQSLRLCTFEASDQSDEET